MCIITNILYYLLITLFLQTAHLLWTSTILCITIPSTYICIPSYTYTPPPHHLPLTQLLTYAPPATTHHKIFSHTHYSLNTHPVHPFHHASYSSSYRKDYDMRKARMWVGVRPWLNVWGRWITLVPNLHQDLPLKNPAKWPTTHQLHNLTPSPLPPPNSNIDRLSPF